MVIPGTKHAILKHVKHTQALSPLTWLPKQNTKKNEGHGTEADCWYAGHRLPTLSPLALPEPNFYLSILFITYYMRLPITISLIVYEPYLREKVKKSSYTIQTCTIFAFLTYFFHIFHDIPSFLPHFSYFLRPSLLLNYCIVYIASTI